MLVNTRRRSGSIRSILVVVGAWLFFMRKIQAAQ
jgi:hypothetical protein